MEENYQILIADDDKEGVKALSKILQNEGYSVRIALNGELALESSLLQPPELILMDMQMPVMDGMTACQKLKTNPKTQDIPVIFITSMDVDFNKVKAFEHGAIDYITKPYSLAEVKSRVKTHLELSLIRKKLDYQNTNLEEIVNNRTEQLKTALEEKQVLVKEIHHRINNNLQILLSLLRIHSNHVQFNSTEELLNNFTEHITIISKINNMLYQTNNFIDIDFLSFLNDFNNIIIYPPNFNKFNFEIKKSQFHIDINHSIPLAHIIKELITHCIKFNKTIENRVVQIDLKSENENFEVIITDNSNGIEKMIDYESGKDPNTVLLSVFLKQLDAELSFTFMDKTIFSINFDFGNIKQYNDIEDIINSAFNN